VNQLAGAVATQASLQALAQQAATQASVAALSQKLDALGAAISALQSEVAIIRQLVDKNGNGPK
jgi:prefoldin subunit 5